MVTIDTPLVLDASAATRVVLSPADHRNWIALLAEAVDVIAPSQFTAEVANTLWKYVKAGHLSATEAVDHLSDALALVSLWEQDIDLLPAALVMASKTNHPVYDCLYLQCCKQHPNAKLLSADKRLNALYQNCQVDS